MSSIRKGHARQRMMRTKKECTPRVSAKRDHALFTRVVRSAARRALPWTVADRDPRPALPYVSALTRADVTAVSKHVPCGAARQAGDVLRSYVSLLSIIKMRFAPNIRFLGPELFTRNILDMTTGPAHERA